MPNINPRKNNYSQCKTDTFIKIIDEGADSLLLVCSCNWGAIPRAPPSNLNKKIQIGGKDMAYNKAKEESKWKAWKQKEEDQMRLSDVPEDIILRIRELDWQSFKAERGYYEKVYSDIPYIERQTNKPEVDIMTIADLLNEIESRALFEALLSVDKLTLEIILLKMQGYSVRESAKKLGITEKSAYRRFDRLKEKIKKVL